MSLAKPTHTPPRSVRIEEALWCATKTTAAQRGETATGVITRALTAYVQETVVDTEPTDPAFDLLMAILANHGKGRDADSLGLIECALADARKAAS